MVFSGLALLKPANAPPTDLDDAIPVLVAAVLGAAIGAERE